MRHRVMMILAVCLAAACSGSIEGPAGERPGGQLPGGPPAGTDPSQPVAGASPMTPAPVAPGAAPTPVTPVARDAMASGALPACKTPGVVGASPLRRLTRVEYDNTVRDLLNAREPVSASFSPDEVLGGFASNAGAPVTQVALEAYHKAAIVLADRALANPGALLGCDAASMGTDACARRFITTFGRRAYRRPLAQAEVDRLLAVHAERKGRSDFLGGIRLVLVTMLSSPHFLYRVELGRPVGGAPGVNALDGWEVASRLSYFLWGTMPDDALLAAAEAGRLARPDDIAAESRRMLRDPKAAGALGGFFVQWLGVSAVEALDKDEKAFPQFTPELRRAMKAEIALSTAHQLGAGDGRLATLFESPLSFVDQPLAAFYGVQGRPAAGETRQVELPAAQRAGLLTRAAFLAVGADTNESSPIRRGLFVRESVLCQEIPPPPPDVDAALPPPNPTLTLRARLAEHRKNPACGGCHEMMDPIGFAFERYDAIGRFRTTEAGRPVDARGEVKHTIDADGAFDGAIELARRLAASEEVRACVAKHWFRYALARDAAEADGCSLAASYGRFAGAGYDLRELLVALASSDAFRFNAAR